MGGTHADQLNFARRISIKKGDIPVRVGVNLAYEAIANQTHSILFQDSLLLLQKNRAAFNSPRGTSPNLCKGSESKGTIVPLKLIKPSTIS
jgi:hypothetical protein